MVTHFFAQSFVYVLGCPTLSMFFLPSPFPPPSYSLLFLPFTIPFFVFFPFYCFFLLDKDSLYKSLLWWLYQSSTKSAAKQSKRLKKKILTGECLRLFIIKMPSHTEIFRIQYRFAYMHAQGANFMIV